LFQRQILSVDELVAGGNKRFGRLSVSKSIHNQAGLSDSGCQPGVIAVARYYAKPVSKKTLRVQQVHGVDDRGGIRRVLAHRVCELLDRLDRLFEQLVFPLLQVGASPSA
jgi:hypothetical protein